MRVKRYSFAKNEDRSRIFPDIQHLSTHAAIFQGCLLSGFDQQLESACTRSLNSLDEDFSRLSHHFIGHLDFIAGYGSLVRNLHFLAHI